MQTINQITRPFYFMFCYVIGLLRLTTPPICKNLTVGWPYYFIAFARVKQSNLLSFIKSSYFCYPRYTNQLLIKIYQMAKNVFILGKNKFIQPRHPAWPVVAGWPGYL
jgi:hypothetical protein